MPYTFKPYIHMQALSLNTKTPSRKELPKPESPGSPRPKPYLDPKQPTFLGNPNMISLYKSLKW